MFLSLAEFIWLLQQHAAEEAGVRRHHDLRDNILGELGGGDNSSNNINSSRGISNNINSRGISNNNSRGISNNHNYIPVEQLGPGALDHDHLGLPVAQLLLQRLRVQLRIRLLVLR